MGKYPFYRDLNIDLNNYNSDSKNGIKSKVKKDVYSSVNPKNILPYPAELDDLIRLHFLAVTRRVTTILEFGVGKSTVVFDNALEINKNSHKLFVTNHMRRSNAFECHSVDNSKFYINNCKKTIN